MATCKIIFALFFGIVAANSDTTTIMISGFGIPPTVTFLPDIAASIISANPTATTCSLTCLQGNKCGVFPKQIQVFGPSTYRIEMEDPNPDTSATAWIECSMSKGAVCTQSWSEFHQEPEIVTITLPPHSIGAVGLLVTAGLEKLPDAPVKPTGTGSGGAQINGTVSNGWTAPALPTSTYPPRPTGAASANAVVSGGLLSLAAAVFGGLLL